MLSSGSPVGLVGSSSIMQSQSGSSLTAYGDRPQLGLDVEFGVDPASGAFFQSEGRKHEDLKQMLDSNKDGLKLEAMKRIISMIARGRDASDLFPAVVKNVVSKNIEVKKLVYVYLVRYAEEQQDLALLSISTFQRALKDPNQLIRASALRVLSSIRVPMIVPIVMLAVRESVADMSAYVRKTAAHAIPKIYALDREQKEELVTVLDRLLGDRTTLVVGSAVMAFEEVCPERVDLIHKNYRKLCNLLVDVDEWGQVIIINMLTRYARTQFLNPNLEEAQESKTAEKFYEESASSADEGQQKRAHVDLDHRLLLRQTKPLLQSRNASVVMAVAQLYHHIAPRNEVPIIAKALVRLLRAHKEIQSVVLTCIASMSTKRKSIFETHVKSFFVLTSDPTHIKLLKLDVLTNLATAGNITLILREFQTYICSNDAAFVAATIQAIGTCAASIEEVTETCLNGLVQLLANHDENIVAESVIVIKKLLQTKATENFQIITRMAKLLDFITAPAARAAIIWLIGEYNEKVPKIAPDVLRKMAKSFADEENIVKMQVLNLGVKLFITNPEQTSLLVQYVFTLARYDTNYDIRDRARFLRQIILPASGESTVLSERAREIFLTAKPAPALESKWLARNNYQIGSLSHYLNIRATGYKDLPEFPSVAPDSSVRNVEGFMPESKHASKAVEDNKTQKKTVQKHSQKENNFYSDSNKSSSYANSETSESSDSSESTTSDEEEEEQEKELPTSSKKQQQKTQKTATILCDLEADTKAVSSESSESTRGKKSKAKKQRKQKKETNILCDLENDAKNTSSEEETSKSKKLKNKKQQKEDEILCDLMGETKTTEVEGTSDSQESSSSSSTESDESAEFEPKKEQKKQKSLEKAEKTNKQPEKSNMDLLLDLDDIPPMGPIMTPSLGGFLTPGFSNTKVTLMPQNANERIELVSPSYVELKHKELLNKLTGHGLYVGYRYTRAPHLYSASMLSIELQFINESKHEITNIHLGQKNLPSGMHLHEFAPVQSLLPRQLATSILGLDFNDSTYAIDFELVSSLGQARVTLKPPIGELLRSVLISAEVFREECSKLRGMNEHQTRLQLKTSPVDLNKLQQKVFEFTNVAKLPVGSGEENTQILRFVGQTMTSKSLVLISIDCGSTEELLLTVNCEKMVIGSMILNELRNALTLAFK